MATTRVQVTAYVRSKLRELSKTKSEAEIGAIVGVSAPMINMIKNLKRGVGADAEEGFAKLLTRGSVDQLRKDARVWCEENPGSLPPEEPVIIYDERYPNRTRAIIAARALGRSELAIASVANMSFKDANDPSPDDWLKDIDAEERRLSREHRDPRGTSKAAAETKSRNEAEIERLKKQASLVERAAAAKARRVVEPPAEEPPRKTGLKPSGKKK